MNVLVTGASGAIGPRIVAALAADGHRVRRLARRSAQALADSGSSIAGSPAADSSIGSRSTNGASIDTVQGDLLDRAAIADAVRGMDAVIHLAALLHRTGPEASHELEYQRVNVDGTRALLDAAREAGVGRVVFASTIAVYGDTRAAGRSTGAQSADARSAGKPATGGLVTEDTPPAPDTAYARTKLAAERLVLDARNASGRPIGVVFRLAAVYGAGLKGNYRALVLALARGRFVPLGRGDNRRSLIHDEDVARAMLLALAHPTAAGRVYNLTDGQLHRVRDIVDAICAALGRRAPRLAVPVPLARAAAATLERLAALAGRRSPVTRAMIDKYLEEAAVDATRVRHELGFAPRVTLAAGWADVVSGLRREGILPEASR